MDPRNDVYGSHSRWTDPGQWTALLADIPPEPEAVVRAVSGLLLNPLVAPMRGIEVPERAAADRELRSVDAILDRIRERDPRALSTTRAENDRCFCVCAGFARLATAVFRTHGLPARCRVGFAAYFTPGHLEDHWVCEYHDGRAWRLLDAELDVQAVRDFGIGFSPWDVPRTEYVDASTAWRRLRTGEVDPARCGLSALGLGGAWFVVGNVLRDAAALNRQEMLPWESWSVALRCAPGQQVPPDVAERLDRVTERLAGAPDASVAESAYRDHEWLRVTPTIMSFADGTPTPVTIDPE